MHQTEEQQLLTFIRSRLIEGPSPSVGPDTPLFEERLLDSIRILDLIAYLEGRLGRRLDDAEIVMPRFRSVGAIMQSFFSDGHAD